MFLLSRYTTCYGCAKFL